MIHFLYTMYFICILLYNFMIQIYIKMYHKFILSSKTLQAINTTECRHCLGIALGVTEQTIINAIKHNRDILTKKTAVEMIKSLTGFSEDEIFINTYARGL